MTSRVLPRFSVKVVSLTDVWIYSLGVALGGETIVASDLVEQFGPVREGFLDRTGFTHLFRVSDEQTGLSLAVEAATTEDSSWWKPAIDSLIYVTSTGDLVAPGNSHLLQNELGLNPGILLLDINDACTGFIRSLHVAESLISSGSASTVLLVLSDTYSKLYDASQLKVSPLFSDGASAIIVSKERIEGAPDSISPRHWEFLSNWFLSEGGRASELSIFRGVDGKPLGALEMNGAGVFNFVLKHLNTCVTQLTSKAHVEIAQVEQWYVHQGSRAVVTAVEKTLGTSSGALFRSGDYGNTVGSSLPFQMYEDRHYASKGETIGLLAFGVGLTMAGMLVEQLPAD